MERGLAWVTAWGAVLAAAIVLGMIGGAPVASADGPTPWWGLTSGSRPTSLPAPESQGQIVVTAQNLGDASANGETSPVTVVDRLPAGLQAVRIEAVAGGPGSFARGPVSCALETLTCTFAGALPPFEEIEVRIGVLVLAGAKNGERDAASVSGGGAAGVVRASHAIVLGGAERFGFEDYELLPENVGGSIDTQAGSHPFQLTSVVTLNTKAPDQQGNPQSVALAKDIVTELPAGLIANPTPLAQCSEAQFAEGIQRPGEFINGCPAAAAVGVATVTLNEPNVFHLTTLTAPIFNMQPLPGEPARFGIKAGGIISAFLDTAVRTGGDYGLTVASNNIAELAWLLSLKLTFWGVPGDRRHDNQRGWECLESLGPCDPSTSASPPPFLVMPTSCGAPFQATVRGDSWGSSARAAEQAEPLTFTLPEAVDGCSRLAFAPQLLLSSDGAAASTPTGLNLDAHVAQTAAPGPESLASSALRNLSVTLPAGVALNPAGTDGLEACSESQVGFTGVAPSGGADLFTGGLQEPFCPSTAKIGTVEIKTPILANPLVGAVYLATQNANPFGSLVAVYAVAEDPVSGTVVKLAGEATLDPQTGQLTATFANIPQLPFEDVELHFFGGDRAPLATPAHCGTYTGQASFAPWSGNEPVSSTSSFDITAGPNTAAQPNGSPCPGPSLPFSPSLTAGTTSVQAGGFSPLSATLAREDGQQALQGFTLRLPPGLAGMLATVPLCAPAQANAGTCPAASLVGETTVSAGVGGDPYTVSGGRIYLTAGIPPEGSDHAGAPFGLSIVTPVKAGPLDLENTPENHPACDCLVIRAKLEVNPQTAALSIVSDASTGGIPSILDGVPLQIRHLNFTIDRPGFIFNSTDCDPLSMTGTIVGAEGGSAPVSSPYKVGGCAGLKFKPSFKVSTAGKTSRSKGASLRVKLSYPRAPFGTQANLKSVKIDLPRALVPRLLTLGGACLESSFNADPASCPAGSVVGQAKVITPLVPGVRGGIRGGIGGGLLTGPVYFVSHGGVRFPELVIVLSGDGLTLQLHAETFINRAGVTSATFRALPDVPVDSFELTLPEGPHSALAANGNLCKGRLKMPTAFTAQNGAVIHESTKISVNGCPPEGSQGKAGAGPRLGIKLAVIGAVKPPALKPTRSAVINLDPVARRRAADMARSGRRASGAVPSSRRAVRAPRNEPRGGLR